MRTNALGNKLTLVSKTKKPSNLLRPSPDPFPLFQEERFFGFGSAYLV
jgi:hypothetical protein